MPRRTTGLRRRARAEDFTPAQVDYCFFGGAALSSNPFRSGDDHRAFWKMHRDILLRWFCYGVPDDFPRMFGFAPGDPSRQPHGVDCRPDAWWRFDAPERRRVVGVTESHPRGDGYMDFRTRPPTPEEVAEIWDAGRRWGSGRHNGYPGFGGMYVLESEGEYLNRLGLMAPGGPEAA